MNIKKIFKLIKNVFVATLISISIHDFLFAVVIDNQQNNNYNQNYGQQTQASVTLRPSDSDANTINNLFQNAKYKNITQYKPENPFYNTDKSSSGY